MRFNRAIFISFTAVLLFTGIVSCGKKGPPRPPESIAPSPVRSFSISPAVDSVVLSWIAPTTNASGESLINLAGFVVKRNELRKNRRPRFRNIGRVSFNPDLQNVEAAGPFSFTDKRVTPGKTYQYLVLPINERGVEGSGAGIVGVNFRGESSIIERY